MSGETDAGTGVRKRFPIFAVSGFGIVVIFVGNRAMVYKLCAAIADIRGPVQTVNQGMFGCRWGRKHISRHREQFFHRHFSFCNGTDECRSYGHYRRYLYATNQKVDGI